MARTVVIDPVTRIEGHARINLDINDAGEVTAGHLQVLELRGLEKLLEKSELLKMPQVTARICGVCPVAHHLASVQAIENGLGVTPPADARLLRELLNFGALLHSHALSTFVLAGPDILAGLDAQPAARNIFSLLGLHPELAKRALRLRSIGQKTVEIVGGRGVHPVAAIPGGMSARPDKEKLEVISGWGSEALALLDEVLGTVRERLAGLAYLREATALPLRSLALSRDGAVDFLSGDVVSMETSGARSRTFTTAQYASELMEHVVPGSYMKALHLRPDGRDQFFVGPLARLNVNDSIPSPRANEALAHFHAAGRPRLSALDYVEARLIEMVHAAERIAVIPSQLTGGTLHIDVAPQAGRFIGLVEAPRGILIHDYTADASGKVCEVNLIVATQGNYDAIDTAITSMARHLLPKKDDNLLMNGVEFALRCFDPCLSCATHAAGRMPMEVVIRHEGEVLRRLMRKAE